MSDKEKKDSHGLSPVHSDSADQIILPVIGLIVFVLIFCTGVPLLFLKLSKGKHPQFVLLILAYYLGNLDLIATCLGFKSGPFKSGMFQLIYTRPETFIGWLSYNLISLITLISILFIVLLKVDMMHIDNRLDHYLLILSHFGIILTITFLLPNRYVEQAMEFTFNTLLKDINKEQYTLAWFISFFVGILVSIAAIMTEAYINVEMNNIYLKKQFLKTYFSRIFTKLFKLEKKFLTK